ncbi:DMT family transporter [Shimwellia pseudoproteus]|uniref:DMT family transporter n=1 Tax=Shimwellia pseudoproteus TaxID=570012 RepID=UPI001E52349B|nr:DMT family transporter [Shimwellia pseudoproteus]MBJ3817034.1 DMT family transporter [Shimwellia pseudoproteus]
MFHVIMIVLAVAAGALLSVQAAVNARLSQSHGVLRTTFFTFLVGTVFSALMVLFLEPAHPVSLLDVPKWQLLGSLLGLVYVLAMVFAVQRIGAAIATIAVILGQLSMSVIIDTFGWLGNQAIAFSWSRFGAALCLAAALWFIYRGNNRPVASPRLAGSTQ